MEAMQKYPYEKLRLSKATCLLFNVFHRRRHTIGIAQATCQRICKTLHTTQSRTREAERNSANMHADVQPQLRIFPPCSSRGLSYLVSNCMSQRCNSSLNSSEVKVFTTSERECFSFLLRILCCCCCCWSESLVKK